MNEQPALAAVAESELSRPIALTIPGRFFHTVRGQSRQTSLEQLRELGQLFLRSAMVVGDLYLRICGHVRSYDLDADEVAQVLREAGFPASRISEICRVSFAPAHIYTEFMCSGMSFRVALTKTRMYYEARRGDRRVKRRKLRRASARVIRLLGDAGGGPWEYRAKNYVLSVVATEHNKHCAYYYHWQGLLNYLVAHA